MRATRRRVRAALLLLATFIFTFRLSRRLHRALVLGPSMAPTLLEGDRVLVDRTAYRRTPPRPGDIVLARVASVPGERVIKRVTELGPDPDYRTTSQVPQHVTVWLQGDNLTWSTDSRHFGPVPTRDLIGRVWYRYYPPERRGRVQASHQNQ